MNDEQSEPTHKPTADAKIELRGYNLVIRFYPEIKLGARRGHAFAASLADYLALEKNEYESHKWTFTEPLAGDQSGKFIITVTPSSITFDLQSPPVQGQEWVEHKIEPALRKFAEEFKPGMTLHSRIIVRGLYPVDGDARTCLSLHVMRMNPQKTDPFGRPIHLIGLRFFFPPFKKREGEGEKTTEWAVDLKAESYMEDPSKLFLEAKAEWFDATNWTDKVTAEVLSHLETVKSYLENNVVGFLKAATEGDEPSGDKEEGE